MSVTLHWTNMPFLRCGLKFKISPDDSDSGSKNINKPMVATVLVSGGVCGWREFGVKRSVLCWCRWEKSGFSRHDDVLTFNLFKKEMVYILYFQ